MTYDEMNAKFKRLVPEYQKLVIAKIEELINEQHQEDAGSSEKD